MKIRTCLNFKPPWFFYLQKQFLNEFLVLTSLQPKYFLKKTFRRSVALYDLVLCINFIWFSISTYVNTGTAKVPLLAKIGVRVQGSTSKIWNYPRTSFIDFFLRGIFVDVSLSESAGATL